MGYFISDKQVLASAMERSLYRPFGVRVEGADRVDEIIDPGHPLYLQLCNIFTLTNTTDAPIVYPVFPTGCISIAFLQRQGEWRNYLLGAMTEIRALTLAPGDQYLILRFMPGSSMAFLDCDAAALTNRTEDVASVIRNGSRLQMIAQRDIPVSLKALLMSRVLRVESHERDSDYLIHFCAEEILKEKGVISITELAEKAGFSERYIGQMFDRYIGLSPKVYSEIIRLQSSLRLVLTDSVDPEPQGFSNGWVTVFGGRPKKNAPANQKESAPAAKKTSLLEVAVESGYFDHAHMNRAYKRFLHCSSGALRKKGLEAIDMTTVAPLLD